MYKIGICDDSKLTCTELENMLRDIMQSLRIEAEIEPWYSGESLCKYLEAGNRFDLIFLDIELLKLSGIDVGNYIRKDVYKRQHLKRAIIEPVTNVSRDKLI